MSTLVRTVLASSFADPADIAAFDHCKAKGNTDQACFRVGDNGIGFWGQSTREGTGPSCALPPEDIISVWGTLRLSKTAPKLTEHMKKTAEALELKPGIVQFLALTKGVKRVLVTVAGRQIECVVKDTMPHRANIHNGCLLDLNPDAAAELHLHPPFIVHATWQPILNQSSRKKAS